MPATLSALRIRNLALVEELDWTLPPGFTAVTGETGAGKSVILGALDLLVGERADRSLIRSGAEHCSVEAVFQLDDPAPLDARLAEQGVDPCEGGELLVKRALSQSGNRQFVNCSATTLAVLKDLGDDLVDLHGPHDHQSLFSPDKQREALDAFAGADGAMHRYGQAYRALVRLRAEHRELAQGEAVLEQEIELLKHQVHEIESARLEPGEEAPLLARHAKAANSRRLAEIAARLTEGLSGENDSALSRLAEIGRSLRELERLDPSTSALCEAHTRAMVELEEIGRDLLGYGESLDLAPSELATMEERIGLIESLKRKYGPDIEEILAFGERAASRLRRIEGRGEELARLSAAIVSAEKTVAAAGGKLSGLRSKAAPLMAEAVRGHLGDLGFEQAGFEVRLQGEPAPRPGGMETAEFLFAPNPGEPERPLRAIASSGELSRVMLALKTTLASRDAIPVLVFDEIDANVGGEIAHAVGAKMAALGEHHQVLCITHLPQVAARASRHFVVRKEFLQQRTHSLLEEVRGDDRVAEIARMLGGKTDTALALARTLLEGNSSPPPRRAARK